MITNEYVTDLQIKLDGYKKVAEVATDLLLEILSATEETGLLHQYPERFKIWYSTHNKKVIGAK